MKTLTIPPHLPLGLSDSATMVNLRPSRQLNDALRPVDAPTPVIQYSGSPVCVHTDTLGHTTLFAVDGSKLTAFDPILPPITLFDTTAADITTSLPLADRIIFQRRGTSPIEAVKIDGRWEMRSNLPLPKVCFSVDTTVSLTGRTPARTLAGNYSHWTGPADQSDITTLSSDLLSLYTSLADRARLSGRYIQPIIIWWRLVDIYGRVYHRSFPVMIGPEGLQAVDTVKSTVTNVSGRWSALNGFPLSLKSFSTAVTVTPSRWIGHKVEIMVTPPVEVINLNGDAVFTFGPSSTTEATLVAALPSSDPDTIVAAMLDRLDTISVVAASIGADSSETTTVQIRPERILSHRDETAYTTRLLRRPIVETDPLLLQCRLPHSFSANASLSTADTIVWGDITPVASLPPSPSDCSVATTTTDSPWATAALLSDSVAGQLSATTSGNSSAPMLLSALSCYPSPTARSLTMQLSSESFGGRRLCTLPLTSTPGHRWAFHCNPGLKPLDPASWPQPDEPLQPVTSRNPSARHSSLLVARPDDPLNPQIAPALVDGCIKAITTAARSSSAWDFARRHFYIFTSKSTCAMSVSRTSWTTSVSNILPVGISTPAMVIPTPLGVMAVGTDGVIRRINGSSASTFLCPEPSIINAIAWSSDTGELWTITDDDPPVTVYVDATISRYHRNDINPRHLLSDSAQLFIPVDGTLYKVVRDNIRPLTTVSMTIRRPVLNKAVRHIRWAITSSMANLTLDLRGDNGKSHRSQRIAAVTTAGPINAPISIPTPFAPPFACISLNLSGSISHDTIIAPTIIT